MLQDFLQYWIERENETSNAIAKTIDFIKSERDEGDDVNPFTLIRAYAVSNLETLYSDFDKLILFSSSIFKASRKNIPNCGHCDIAYINKYHQIVLIQLWTDYPLGSSFTIRRRRNRNRGKLENHINRLKINLSYEHDIPITKILSNLITTDRDMHYRNNRGKIDDSLLIFFSDIDNWLTKI